MKVLKKFSLIFHSLKLSLIVIILNEVISQDFQPITPKILTTGTSLMDVKDYENINLITTKKEIFTGLNPEKKGEFAEEFPQSSSFATFNSEIILAACTNKALFSYIKISSSNLEEISLISYLDFNLEKTNYACSLSYLDPYAYIVHTSGSKIINMLKIKIILDSSGLSYEKELNFTFPKPEIVSKDFRLVLCEPVQLKDNLQNLQNSILLCGYSEYVNSEYNYYAKPIYPPEFDKTPQRSISSSKDLNFFKFQKINSTDIRYLIGDNSYENYALRKMVYASTQKIHQIFI